MLKKPLLILVIITVRNIWLYIKDCLLTLVAPRPHICGGAIPSSPTKATYMWPEAWVCVGQLAIARMWGIRKSYSPNLQRWQRDIPTVHQHSLGFPYDVITSDDRKTLARRADVCWTDKMAAAVPHDSCDIVRSCLADGSHNELSCSLLCLQAEPLSMRSSLT